MTAWYVRTRATRIGRLARATALAAVLVATAVLGWRKWQPRPIPLAPDWDAAVLVLAGDGVAGVRDGDAVRARFSDPFGVAVGIDGTVYVSDAGEAQRIRRIARDGTVSTVAGGEPGFADGRGAAARFNSPSGLAIDVGGTLYVADTGNHAIRRITPDGLVSTLAGDGVAGDLDGTGRQARFNGPIGVAVHASGRVIVADTYNDRIRAIDPRGVVTTLAGGGARRLTTPDALSPAALTPAALDGPGALARFDTPCGVAIDASGAIHVADTGHGLIRTIDTTGHVTTRGWGPLDAPLPPIGGPARGIPPIAAPPVGTPPFDIGPIDLRPFHIRPVGIAAGPNGVLYVTDDRGRVVEIAADGRTRTLAGSMPGFQDGPGRDARFRAPAGIAVAGPGRLIVGDAGNALVRLVAAHSRLELRPPAPPGIDPHFDRDRFAARPLRWPVPPTLGPHEIAGTLGEARGADSQRFHAGIDVRMDEGTPVEAVRDAIVASPIATGDFGSLNEWLRLGPVGYVHLRAGRGRAGQAIDPARFVPTYDDDGALVRVRVRRGTRFAAGDTIGTVNAFNHVHLNVGWPGEEINPLEFGPVQFEDTVPPTIARGGVRLYDEHGQPLTRRVRGRLAIAGRVRVVVDAWDQADGNRPGRRLGLYDLGYQVLRPDGTPAPGFDAVRHTLRFDRLAVRPDAARLVYASGSGIPFFGRRRTRFLYIVTNTLRDGIAAEQFWDTGLLAHGPYVLRVRAADIRGNTAVANRDLPVTVGAPAPVAP